VSVRKSETIEITESQETDSLAESKINTSLTTSNKQEKVNTPIPCIEEISVKLTDSDNQEDESQADASQLAQEEITSGEEVAQSESNDKDVENVGEVGKTYLVHQDVDGCVEWVEAVLIDVPNPFINRLDFHERWRTTIPSFRAR